MKRISVVGVVVALCALLLIATIASSAVTTKKYSGDIEKGGTVDFTIRTTKRPGHPRRSKVVKFVFEELVVDCQGHPNPESTSGNTDFRVPIRNRKFQINATLGDPDSPRAALKVRGELTAPRKAKGTIRVHGSAVPLDPPAGGTGNCESTTQDWTAHRVPA